MQKSLVFSLSSAFQTVGEKIAEHCSPTPNIEAHGVLRPVKNLEARVHTGHPEGESLRLS